MSVEKRSPDAPVPERIHAQPKSDVFINVEKSDDILKKDLSRLLNKDQEINLKDERQIKI